MDQPTKYRRLHPASAVRAYQEGADHLWVCFEHAGRRRAYRYPQALVGAAVLAEMKRRARRGAGLSTFIAQHLRGRHWYDRVVELS